MKVKRRSCQYPNCKKLGRNKGYYKGNTRYDRFCEVHHRLRYKFGDYYLNGITGKIPNKKCEVCGWDKASCDRHRIDPKQGYKRENVKVLCPNCHRLVTLGIVK